MVMVFVVVMTAAALFIVVVVIMFVVVMAAAALFIVMVVVFMVLVVAAMLHIVVFAMMLAALFVTGMVSMSLAVVIMLMVLMIVALVFMVFVFMAVAIVTVGMVVLVGMMVIMLMCMANVAVVMLVRVVMVVLMAVTLIIVVMMLVVLVTAAALFTVIMVMMVLFFHLLELVFKGISVLHSLKNLLSGDSIPGSCYNLGFFIVLADKLDSLMELIFLNAVGAAENYAAGVFYLVIKKLAEVFHIHFALISVSYGDTAVKAEAFNVLVLYCLYYVAELTYTGRLNKDSVGSKLCNNFLESLSKIANEAAADAAGVHLGNIDTGLLQKAAVNSDFAEFVFYKNQFFAGINFLNKLFDKSCLTCTEETGKNVYFCHLEKPAFDILFQIIIISSLSSFLNILCRDSFNFHSLLKHLYDYDKINKTTKKDVFR